MDVDRRAAPRQRVNLRAGYRAGGQQRYGELFDLGTDGVFICTREPLEPGSRLGVTIHSPGERGVVCADGLVVWANLVHTEALPAGMGVRFLVLDAADRARLEEQLAALA